MDLDGVSVVSRATWGFALGVKSPGGRAGLSLLSAYLMASDFISPGCV